MRMNASLAVTKPYVCTKTKTVPSGPQVVSDFYCVWLIANMSVYANFKSAVSIAT
jgi:hypothetical protein